MTAERDLGRLPSGMAPQLALDTYVFVSVPSEVPPGVRPFATVREDEGLTLVLARDDAASAGLTADFEAARIISCNVVAGFHHDHLFVPADRTDEAMSVLGGLARSSAGPDPPVGLTARPPRQEDHSPCPRRARRVVHGLGGECGARERGLLVPPLFLQHFADTSVVEDAEDRLAAFLIGFLSSSQPGTAYPHFVGIDPCVTGPANDASIAYHRRMGSTIEPGPREVGGVPVQPDYDGPGIDRVCCVRSLEPTT